MAQAETHPTQTALAAAGDLSAAVGIWLHGLERSRRLSAATIEAYGRDAAQFCAFLQDHLGAPPGLDDMAALSVGDIRAFLAMRRRAGIGARSLARALSALRSLARHLKKVHRIEVTALVSIRGPKLPHALPKPVSPRHAADICAGVGMDENAERWIEARDIAVFTLLYGAGLRIAEALALTRRAFAAAGDTLRVTGKGGRTRIVPLLPVVREAVEAYDRPARTCGPADGAIFVGARGGPLNPRIIQRAMAAHARRPRPSRQRHPACPAPCLRHAHPDGRRGTCARSRNCSATPACRRRRSIPTSTRRTFCRCTGRRTRAPDARGRR